MWDGSQTDPFVTRCNNKKGFFQAPVSSASQNIAISENCSFLTQGDTSEKKKGKHFHL